MAEAADRLPLVFVAHPRTIKQLKAFGLDDLVSSASGIHLLEPLPYIRFMNLVTGARVVITDSGGLQEETTYLGIPCLTLRENTERPITVSMGTNELCTPGELFEKLSLIIRDQWKAGERPPLWDGKTAERAVDALERRSSEAGSL